MWSGSDVDGRGSTDRVVALTCDEGAYSMGVMETVRRTLGFRQSTAPAPSIQIPKPEGDAAREDDSSAPVLGLDAREPSSAADDSHQGEASAEHRSDPEILQGSADQVPGPPPTLDWETIPAASIGDYPDLLAELYSRTRDGVTIEGVFSPEEIERALAALERHPSERRYHIAFGWLIGMPLGMITEDEPDRSRYLDAADEARADYLEIFGFDPHERIAKVLAPVTPGIKLIGAPDSGRNYNAGQLRGYAPGRGGLPAHVGNEFRRQLENGAMKSLVTTTRLTDHLSYFEVLQRP